MTLAVGIYNPRRREEFQRMRQIARIYQADFTFTLNAEQRLVPLLAGLMIPNINIPSLPDYLEYMQAKGLTTVALETGYGTLPLADLIMPEQAAILIGPENGTIMQDVLDVQDAVVRIDTPSPHTFLPSTALAIALNRRYEQITRQAVA